MAHIVGSSQRNINNLVQNIAASQLATKNSYQYQSDQFNQFQNYQSYGIGGISPLKANIDNLYDQNGDQQSIQAGSSLTLAVSQRNSQISIKDYHINYEDALLNKQSVKKQNISPWRRNINNQKVIIGSKNGFYINNDNSTISSSSAQKQNSYQQSMSPRNSKLNQQSLNSNELQSQKGRNRMNSSYFLHVDTQQNQQDNLVQIYSKNNNRSNHYQHRNNQSSSPQQSQANLANDLVHYSNSNKSQHRKNYQHHNQRKVITSSDGDNALNQSSNPGGQTPINIINKQKKDPQTARTSLQISNNQKKLRLHSLNANIHRIFKEDKFQQQSNSQFNSESTDQSQKRIPHSKDYQTKVSQDNLSIKDQNINSNQNMDDNEQQNNPPKQRESSSKENIQKQEISEQKGLSLSQITASGTDQDNIQGKVTGKEISQDSIMNQVNDAEVENGYNIQSNAEQKKIKSFTQDAHFQGGQKIDILNDNIKIKDCKQSIKVLHTEPDDESRRQNKIKNIRYNKNNQQYNNQQLNTQQDLSQNNRAQVVSTSPRNNYNFKQRSNTQASTSNIPPKINMEAIRDQKMSPRQSQFESPVNISQSQMENQDNIIKLEGYSNQFYFINNSPLLKCKVSSSRNGYKSRKNGGNSAFKNYINNSLMIKQNYLNLQQQIQGKQCRTQVDSSFNLNQSENKKSPALMSKNTDRDNNSIQQYLSIHETDQNHQNNLDLDLKYQSKDAISKFQGNLLDLGFNNHKQPLKELENNTQNHFLDQNQPKNKLIKQDIPSHQRGKSLQQNQRQYINNEISNNAPSGYSKKLSAANNTSIDNKQQKIKLRHKIYSTNSSNQSLNASILEKSQIYVDKYKNNLQNDLSLIQKIDKQKQIRESDLYNVSYNDKKLEYAQEIDKKIQYLSHSKIESSDLRSNQQNQNYSPKITQSSQSGNYQNFHPLSISSQSQNNNPYSPIFVRGNTQMNDYNNIHTSLSNMTQNDQINQQNQSNQYYTENIKNNLKNDLSKSQNTMRENDTQLSYIWRKLAYQREKGKLNQSSLEQELEKIDQLSKKNEKALNQYVQIKEDAIQMSQFLESHLNQKRARANSQNNI